MLHRVRLMIRIVSVASMIILSEPWTASAGQPDRLSEYEVKAGFLFNVAKFVTWPDGAFPEDRTEIVFAVLGDDPFGSAIDAIQGRSVQGRPVSVIRFKELPEDAGCHLLFVAQSEASRLDRILKSVKGPVLTVSDIDDFSERGGCITLVLHDDRVRIRTNPGAATRLNLALSAKLLQLSTIIKDAGQ